jgi:cell division protein FtsA
MTDQTFHTFIDLGKTAIRGSSFNKESKKVENHIELKIQNDLINNLSNEEKLIEDLIFNLEKKNGEYLNEIFLMVNNSNILSISITISKKSGEQILDNNFIKYITDEAKFEINKNYPNYEIVHSIIKNFFIDEKIFSEIPSYLNHKKFAVEFNFFVYPKFFLENLKKIFARQNVIIKKFIFSSYSKSVFYLDKISDQKKKIFVDIGFEKTSAFLFENKKMEQFKIIPIGGNHITKDVSKILEIEIPKADKIKLNFNNIDSDKSLKKDQIELVKKVIFARIEELLEISTLFFTTNDDLKNVKLVFFGNGSKILDCKFKSSIIFNYDIDLLDENYIDICLSGLDLINNEEEILVDKFDFKNKKKGIFEKFFNLFG